jgi:hypothetical protein
VAEEVVAAGMPVAVLSPLELGGSASRSAEPAGGGAELIAALVEALPGGLRRRLEADPALAAGWRWSPARSGLAAEATSEAIVTLPAAGVVASASRSSASARCRPAACTWRPCYGALLAADARSADVIVKGRATKDEARRVHLTPAARRVVSGQGDCY